MNININYGGGIILSGFTNLDPIANADGIINRDVKNLDDFCEDAECQRIVAEDVIDYFHFYEIDGIVSNWISKLRKKGTIIIGGVDINEVARNLTTKNINIMQANEIIHGEPDKPRKSTTSLLEICNYLESYDLKILKKKINNYHYSIEAVRG